MRKTGSVCPTRSGQVRGYMQGSMNANMALSRRQPPLYNAAEQASKCSPSVGTSESLRRA